MSVELHGFANRILSVRVKYLVTIAITYNIFAWTVNAYTLGFVQTVRNYWATCTEDR